MSETTAAERSLQRPRRPTAGCATATSGRRGERARGGRPASGALARAVAGAVQQPHPGRRPRRARPRLHPRDAAAAVAARQPLLPRRGPRAGQHPRGRPGPARRQPLRRQPHARHASSSRSPSTPTSASSGAFYQLAHNLVLSMPGLGFLRKYGTVAASPENAAQGAGLRRGAARLPRRRLRGPPAVWERNRVDFGGRKGFIRLALEHDVPIVPVVAIGGQETVALPHAAASASPSCSASTSSSG